MMIIFSESYKKLVIFLEFLLVGPGERIQDGDQSSFKIFDQELSQFFHFWSRIAINVICLTSNVNLDINAWEPTHAT